MPCDLSYFPHLTSKEEGLISHFEYREIEAEKDSVTVEVMVGE